MDFDPGPGVYNLINLTHKPNFYVAKYDSLGSFIWAKHLPGANTYGLAWGLVSDNIGNVYVGGRFSDTVDFDPGPLNKQLITSGADGFILKLTKDGNYEWVKQFSNKGTKNWETVQSITIDGSNNIYAVGQYVDSVDLEPGKAEFSLKSNGMADIYLLKINSSGTLIWGKTIGGSENDWGYEIKATSDRKIYTVGTYQNTVDFDPNAGYYSISSAGIMDIFIHKMEDNAVSVSKVSKDKGISIYPNPNKGHFKLNLSEKNPDFKMQITNSLGQTIYTKEKLDYSNDISLGLAIPGAYFLSIYNGDQLKYESTIVVE